MNVGRGQGRGGRTLLAEINVTPMADVIIVLLIVFMVAVPILQQSPVPLPAALHAKAGPEDELTIVVTAAGQVTIDGLPALSASDVTTVLRARRADVAVPVRIEAARDASYALVAGVLQACRDAGVEEIGLGVAPGLPTRSGTS